MFLHISMWHSRLIREFQLLSANPLKCKSLSPRTITWIRRLWNSKPQKKSSLKKYTIVCLSEKQMEYQWPEHPKRVTQHNIFCRQAKKAIAHPKSKACNKLTSIAGTRIFYSTLHTSANAVNLLTIITTTQKVNLTCQLCSTNQLKSINGWLLSLCQRAQQVRWWAELL